MRVKKSIDLVEDIKLKALYNIYTEYVIQLKHSYSSEDLYLLIECIEAMNGRAVEVLGDALVEPAEVDNLKKLQEAVKYFEHTGFYPDEKSVDTIRASTAAMVKH